MANTKKKNTGEVDRFTTNGHGVIAGKQTAAQKAQIKKLNAELAKKKKK